MGCSYQQLQIHPRLRFPHHARPMDMGTFNRHVKKGPYCLERTTSPMATFRYQSKFLPAALLGMLAVWLGIGGVIAIFQNSIVAGIFLILVCAPLIGAIGVNAVLSASDVIIDARGISRSIMGRIWKTILWSDVKKIRMVNMPTFSIPFGGMETVFYIDQTDIPRIYFRKGGGIFFTEQVHNIALLLDVLNYYSTFYNVPIYSGQKGREARHDRIDLTDCVAASRRKSK
jgi:hypothetical protein